MWEPGSCCRTGSDTTAPELRAFLLERLADYKVPRQLRIVASLPRNAAGKVMVRELGTPPPPGVAAAVDTAGESEPGPGPGSAQGNTSPPDRTEGRTENGR